MNTCTLVYTPWCQHYDLQAQHAHLWGAVCIKTILFLRIYNYIPVQYASLRMRTEA